MAKRWTRIKVKGRGVVAYERGHSMIERVLASDRPEPQYRWALYVSGQYIADFATPGQARDWTCGNPAVPGDRLQGHRRQVLETRVDGRARPEAADTAAHAGALRGVLGRMEGLMPNNVRHRMTIMGPHNDIRAFVDKARGPIPQSGDAEETAALLNTVPSTDTVPLSFHAIVPLPADYFTRPYDTYGHKAERDAWGVKWGAYDQTEPIAEPRRATYEFTCAWGLPDQFLVAASAAWPTLVFLVSWGGEGPTRGRVKAIRGELSSVISETYETTKHLYPKLAPDADAAAEEAWTAAYNAVELEHVRTHDAWVRGGA